MKRFRLDRVLDSGVDGVVDSLRAEARTIRKRLVSHTLSPHRRRLLTYRLVVLGVLLAKLTH